MFNGRCNVIAATIVSDRGNQENLPASGTIVMKGGHVSVLVTVEEVRLGNCNRCSCKIELDRARIIGLESGLDGEAWCVHIERKEGGFWRFYTDVPTGGKTSEQLKEHARETVAHYRNHRFNH